MRQKGCHRLIYKLHTKRLKDSKWNLNLDLQEELHDYPEDVISLGSSQLLRWIDELNGVTDIDEQARDLQRKIKVEKKKPRSRETKTEINRLYNVLYDLQFQKDYVCIIMDSEKDYDRANQGFTINGVQYRRFLGTNGGIKNSTIVYVNKELYPELKHRLDNGRKMDVPLVPAKLEAYQALVCSGSTPIPEPNGIIVVKDCITHFKEDIILINDENDGEPVMTYEKDYEIEHNDSDGYGLMLPSYSRRVNGDLTGDYDNTISGFNSRGSWIKGMVYTFDFIDFAEKVAGTYEITDVWGQKRDVRNAEVILTESMLKLWNCYDSWEDYYENCKNNHYEFSAAKITPQRLENVRETNYQYLQDIDLTDDDIQELCQPTVDEINEVLGLDYRKSLAFLVGFNLDDGNAFNENYEYYVRALMINPEMIKDPFIVHKIWNMISKRMEMAKRGAVRVNANYAMISGDPYALCQSMFGLEITGLLKKGEVYHKYWIDKDSDEIVCFRAPMLNDANIRKMKLNKDEDTAYWYQYITTALIYNAWDSACEAMCGADKDGDTNMCTDNPVLLRHSHNPPSILCIQRKAEKKVTTEEDIIQANKLAFNGDIGIVTNHVTSMIERRAGFGKDSEEYKTLTYRIKCGQMFQQNTIDRAKGIIAKPMPESWYSVRAIDKEDTFNNRIVAPNKPYFMIYVYPQLKKKYNEYIRNSNQNAVRRFRRYKIKNVAGLYELNSKDQEVLDFIRFYEKKMPVGNNPCGVNRISWFAERAFKGIREKRVKTNTFDHSILKSGVQYSKNDYKKIEDLYKEYNIRVETYFSSIETKRPDRDFEWLARHKFANTFKADCEKICPNEDELCDIVLDLCYKSDKAKQFAWDICGDTIIHNLLINSDNAIWYPKRVEEDGEFVYCGEQFVMSKKVIAEDNDLAE